MPFLTLKVGAITIIPLSDGTVNWPVSEVWPSIAADQWEPVRAYLNPDGTHHFNLGSFLIREDETWTLVDTGYGNRPGSDGGALYAELEKVNVRPDDIVRVLITHMHADHVGGCTVDVDGRPVPVFKNARHVIQRRDWAFFQSPETKSGRPHISLCADPIEEAGLLDLIEGSQSISAGISTLLTPGHTAGHQSILVSSGDEKAIILGDASHSAVQIIHPDWSPRFDANPELSTRTRVELFDRIEQEGLTIAAGHYPYPGFGGIVRVEGKRRWQPLN
jgi:glyoxylase-like metal-dependent hydrolase (beta-lactamase superfamily II)